MPEFKRGDKVKIINQYLESKYGHTPEVQQFKGLVGEIGLIDKYSSFVPVMFTIGERTIQYMSKTHNLELFVEPVMVKRKPKYRVVF